MAILIKLKRTNSALNSLTSVVPAEGEAIYSFADSELVIGNGSTSASTLPRFYAKTWQGDVIETTYGGTGNSVGYIRTGLKSGVTAGTNSTAEGIDSSPTGVNSHGEGNTTTASGEASHSEGSTTIASGSASHAEGTNTTASGSSSHAEGGSTIASGVMSHAEGYSTTSSGQYASSSGYGTTANHRSQSVFGEFNVLDDSTEDPTNRGNYVEIVGGGTSASARSNLRTLDWSGNETVAGNILPMAQNTKTLGSPVARWNKVYLGSSNSYGNSTIPVYWNNGVPTAVSSISVNVTGSAAKLTTGRSLKVALGSTSNVLFDGSTNVENIPVSGILPVTNGGTGMNTASYKNAVVIGNSTTVNAAMQTVRTVSGAFYATGTDAKPGFGVLPVAQGGTGWSSYDTTPTSGSTKMITSGGVYNSITTHTHKYAASDSVGGPANSVKANLIFNSSGSGSGSGITYNGSTATTISYNSVGAAPVSHNHNYAGSPSVGGAANSVVNALTFSTSGNGAGNGTIYNGSTARIISYNSVGASPSKHGSTTWHTYNYAGAATDGGAANSALTSNQLTTARTITVNLASTSGASFNGTANITPGVTGTLGVGNGGSGKSSWTANGVVYASATNALNQITPSAASQILISNSNKVPTWSAAASSVTSSGALPPSAAAVYSYVNSSKFAGSNSAGGPATSAVQLTTARSIQTNLASTSAVNFNGTANVEPGVKGILAVGNGGTGKSSWTANGVLYANSTSQLSQAVAGSGNQIMMANSSKVPVWTSPSSTISTTIEIPPSSSAVASALSNIHIEELSSLSSTYIWDTLSSQTYFTMTESTGQLSSAADSVPTNVNRNICCWSNCTAINATTIQLSGTKQYFSMPTWGTGSDSITLPAGYYCVGGLSYSSVSAMPSTYSTTNAVFYTGSSTKQCTWRTAAVGGATGVSIPFVALTLNGQTQVYPAGSSQYQYAPLITTLGGSYSYGTVSAGGYSAVMYYWQSTQGTFVRAGGAVEASSGWITTTGTSSLYTHGISDTTIHLCRGSLADVILQQRIGYYTGNGGATNTISFIKSGIPRIPRALMINARNNDTAQFNSTGSEYVIIDLMSLTSPTFKPQTAQMAISDGNSSGIAVAWTSSACNAITLTFGDYAKVYFNVNQKIYNYFAIA